MNLKRFAASQTNANRA